MKKRMLGDLFELPKSIKVQIIEQLGKLPYTDAHRLIKWVNELELIDTTVASVIEDTIGALMASKKLEGPGAGVAFRDHLDGLKMEVLHWREQERLKAEESVK